MALLVAHTTLLEISCTGSFTSSVENTVDPDQLASDVNLLKYSDKFYFKRLGL